MLHNAIQDVIHFMLFTKDISQLNHQWVNKRSSHAFSLCTCFILFRVAGGWSLFRLSWCVRWGTRWTGCHSYTELNCQVKKRNGCCKSFFLSARELKLLLGLMKQQLICRLPVQRRCLKTPSSGWVLVSFGLCTNPSWLSLVLCRLLSGWVLMIFWAILITCCTIFLSWAVYIPSQFVMSPL